MRKNKFIKSTMILIIGGLITKLLGMIIKIITTRIIGTKGISLYMLILPIYQLFISLSLFSLPSTISKLISEDRYNNKNILSTCFKINILLNIFIIIFIILSNNFIAYNFLKDKRLNIAIISIILAIPFESISNILRGYFLGKEKMFANIVSIITEQIIRLILTIIFLAKIYNYNIYTSIAFLIIINMLSELASIIISLLFLPKKIKINKNDCTTNKNILIKIFNLSIPNSSNKLLSNIGLCLEPIILIYFNKKLKIEYGIITGYIMPILLIPSFFTNAISTSLLPIISKLSVNKEKKEIKRKIIEALLLSLIIIIPYSIIIYLFPNKIIYFIYKTIINNKYINMFLIPFIIFYITIPLEVTMQAINKAKLNFYIDTISILIKLILLIILLSLNFKIYAYIISTTIEIIIVFITHLYCIKKYLKS